ncbi:MAG: hypothetical protein EBY39_07925 [Flavobacteriia bacterium]|nr:hypothetical protein [Flavobacteriia bacterium]
MDNIPRVQPVIITSPFSGSPIRPQIRTRESAGKIYTEAHWYCPDSGRFVKKGVVSIEDKK